MAVIVPDAVPRRPGAPRPVNEPSSDNASAKPMEMPAPTEAPIPTRKVAQVSCVAKAAANSGARVETEPSINPASPGWTYCSTNKRRAVSSSRARASGGQEGLAELVGKTFMLVLGFGELIQELTDRQVARGLRGFAIETRGLKLHGLGIFADLVKAERTRQPERLVVDEALDI